MRIQETGFRDLVEIYPSVWEDNRGYFLELFRKDELAKITNQAFVQDNYSYSNKGVLRGFHFQRPPFEQTKLVVVLEGMVLDVVVDIRENSATFGQHYKCVLNGAKFNMLLVPSGFAHGFLALENSRFFYKCSSFYNREADAGFRWDDPTLGIEWPNGDFILSDKDRDLPDFATALERL